MESDSSIIEPEDFPERETVRRALRGDADAFEKVISLYNRRLFAVAHGVLGNVAEAEDVVQETFLKAYSRRWMIRNPDKLPAWLYSATRNRARDLLRKHRPAFHLDEVGEIADSGTPCPSERLHTAEIDSVVRRLLQTLPENHRIAVTLLFMDGLEYREIEETMGVSNGALRGILTRAMKTLRKGIGPSLLHDLTGAR